MIGKSEADYEREEGMRGGMCSDNDRDRQPCHMLDGRPYMREGNIEHPYSVSGHAVLCGFVKQGILSISKQRESV
jgi:hypothetical protein